MSLTPEARAIAGRWAKACLFAVGVLIAVAVAVEPVTLLVTVPVALLAYLVGVFGRMVTEE